MNIKEHMIIDKRIREGYKNIDNAKDDKENVKKTLDWIKKKYIEEDIIFGGYIRTY